MPVLTGRRIRACLGGLWLLDAVLQSQPHFFTADWWRNDLAQSVMGQPQPVSRSILWATGLLGAHAALANTLAVAVQASIGVCLLLGRLERVAIATSVPWSLGVWWVGEGLGTLPTGFAVLPGGAPGAALLYPLIGLLCRPRRRLPLAEPLLAARPCATVRVGAAARCWAALWATGALLVLPWRFGPAAVLQANIEQGGDGQPAWLSTVSHASYRAVGHHPLLVPAALFCVQLAVGLGVLSARTRRYALAVGSALALLFWVAVQGLGGIASGGATDPGSAPLLVLLAAILAFPEHVQSSPGTEYRSWSSTSRTIRSAPGACVGTTWTSAASRPSRWTPQHCDVFATCTTSSTTRSAT